MVRTWVKHSVSQSEKVSPGLLVKVIGGTKDFPGLSKEGLRAPDSDSRFLELDGRIWC